MTEQEVAIKLNDHDHEIGSLKHRMDSVEHKQESIEAIANSVNKLAINMQYMVEEQKSQSERLSRLESEPVESSKYYRRLIVGTIITTIIGLVVGAIIGKFI